MSLLTVLHTIQKEALYLANNQSPLVNFNKIKIGQAYHRDELTELWGLQGREAISKGVFTPRDLNVIILFVTKVKSTSATQYKDYIIDDFLYWEGENKGRANARIINSKDRGDTIHLFFREHFRQNLMYLGTVEYVDYVPFDNAPYQFVFELVREQQTNKFEEPVFHYANQETEKRVSALSRIGQGAFRVNLLQLWKSCSITDVNMPELLKASHIMPWKDADPKQRLDPYNGLLLTPTLDTLFDRGFISFKNDGEILISKKVEPITGLLKIDSDTKLRHVYTNNIEYLEYHRDIQFKSI